MIFEKLTMSEYLAKGDLRTYLRDHELELKDEQRLAWVKGTAAGLTMSKVCDSDRNEAPSRRKYCPQRLGSKKYLTSGRFDSQDRRL